MFRRIQTRLMIIYSALFILVQGGTYYALYQVIAPSIEDQIEQQLIYGSTLVSQALEDSMQELVGGTKLLAADFGFRSAVATADRPTIFTALENLRERIGSDNAMLISLDNTIIADTSDPSSAYSMRFTHDYLIDIADEEDEAAVLMIMNGRLAEFVIVPVLAPEPIAWIGVSIEIDDPQAGALKALLPDGFDISFLLNQSENNFQFLSSTLPLDRRVNFLADHASTQLDTGKPHMHQTDYDDVMLLSSDLAELQIDAGVVATIQYSMSVAFGPYRSLAFGLSFLVAAGIIILLIGSAIIARGVTQPLRALADATKRIKVGDYKPVDQFENHQEIDQLASSFNHMIDGIVEREQKILHQSNHDIETGLANRQCCENFLEELLAAKDKSLTVTTMIVSIQRFNDIRNTFGYAVGEELIKYIVGGILSITEADKVARLTTSTFAIVYSNISREKAAESAAAFLERLNGPAHLEDIVIDLSLNVGIASYPEDARSVESLLRRANIANHQSWDMIEQLAFYNSDKDNHYADKMSMMSELRFGLEQGQVALHYQPKINLSSGRVSHVEALMRWHHPEKGFILPDEFIPLAEQTGQIQHLTQWALEEAIKQAVAWRMNNIDIMVALNLSAFDLRNKDLPKFIAALLKSYEAKPSWLLLELTESAVMQDPDIALEILGALSDLGLCLSVDDYGTGYSSLSYLKRLPVHELKIDRSFILDLTTNKEDEILVRSTIELGHNLGLKVTAEGVEDHATVGILRDLGCDFAQGYYFSKAIRGDEIPHFIESPPFVLTETVSNKDN